MSNFTCPTCGLKALKWIPDKKDYIPYDLPDGACLYTDNMEQEIACCQCGKKVKFGDCYTSRTIHTELGLGYAECPECYFSYFREQIYGKNNR